MKVLAIDPGYERVGIAVLERLGNTSAAKAEDVLAFSECFKTPATLVFADRLKLIGDEIAAVIEKYEPDILAIETLFFTNNQKTAMGVSEARGVIVYESRKQGLEICEYSPLQIKMATTGYGKSDKKQMIAMIPRLISITKKIAYDDEYDAIAAGITCLASYRAIKNTAKK